MYCHADVACLVLVDAGRDHIEGGPMEGACSIAVPAMITRPRTTAIRMSSTHSASGNANHR